MVIDEISESEGPLGGGTPIYSVLRSSIVRGQDENQQTTTEIVDGQKSNCILAGQESTSHFT